MNITQVASVAGSFEAARTAGVQQAGNAASTATVQRESSRAAAEADVRETETVQETTAKSNTSASGRRVDITV